MDYLQGGRSWLHLVLREGKITSESKGSMEVRRNRVHLVELSTRLSCLSWFLGDDICDFALRKGSRTYEVA